MKTAGKAVFDCILTFGQIPEYLSNLVEKYLNIGSALEVPITISC